MGTYVNPGNYGFTEINDADYVDKTLLIDKLNSTIRSRRKCLAFPDRGASVRVLQQKCSVPIMMCRVIPMTYLMTRK